jgi:hypothetical protein
MPVQSETGPIELRVQDVAQLFHTLDPFPFREKDLDREAEEYIVSWARELPRDGQIRIVVHYPDSEPQSIAAKELSEAFRRYFSYRGGVLQREFNELFRIGRRSLVVGITTLIICLVSAHFAAGYLVETPFGRLVEESFLILGWVANWRPLEIFLYDWWPLARRRALYRRLSEAAVETKPYRSGTLAFAA